VTLFNVDSFLHVLSVPPKRLRGLPWAMMMPSFRKTLDQGCQERDPPNGDIRWTDKTISMPEKTTVYIVRQVELLDQFDTNIFDRMQKKHFSFA
jgi:hypothetical protein